MIGVMILSNFALVFLCFALLVYSSIGFMTVAPAVQAETVLEPRFEPAPGWAPLMSESHGPVFCP